MGIRIYSFYKTQRLIILLAKGMCELLRFPYATDIYKYICMHIAILHIDFAAMTHY